MKRLAMVLALIAVGACQKTEQKPAEMSADTSHMMMSDTSHMMMMSDTSKKMAPAAPATPAAKPAAKKKK